MENSLKLLIPKHKHDFETLDLLKEIDIASLTPIYPDLLSWLQDINWPIAPKLSEILSGAGKLIVPEIKKILQGEDAVWKYWILLYLVKKLDQEVFDLLQDDILLLAERPNALDNKEEVNVAAQEVLTCFKG
jgi:hypothetical protein